MKNKLDERLEDCFEYLIEQLSMGIFFFRAYVILSGIFLVMSNLWIVNNMFSGKN